MNVVRKPDGKSEPEPLSRLHRTNTDEENDDYHEKFHEVFRLERHRGQPRQYLVREENDYAIPSPLDKVQVYQRKVHYDLFFSQHQSIGVRPCRGHLQAEKGTYSRNQEERFQR